MRLIAIGFLVVVAGCSGRRSTSPAGSPPVPAATGRFIRLPDNPCDLLTAEQVAAASGVRILSARRVPDIGEIVRAQRENRRARPGTICNYDASADVGDVVIIIPDVSLQSADAYRKSRDEYARSFPAEKISNVGDDAWMAAGNTLHVLAGRNAQFIVATRYWQPKSRDVVIAVAKTVMSRIAQ